MRLSPRVAGLLLCLGLVLSITAQGDVGSATLAPGGTFTDDDGNLHEPDIEAIVGDSITQGCAFDLYCPDAVVTRAEMAAFLLRATGEAPSSDDRYAGYFVDVPADAWYALLVERLFELGITTGRQDGTYAPDAAVSRAEMAVFLTRAFDLEVQPSSGVFSDVDPLAWYADQVEAVRRAGITKGCRAVPLAYCPSDPVLRDQMASFIARAADLAPIEVLPRRSYTDRPDVSSLHQIHVMYVVPSDGSDRRFDDSQTLALSVTAFERWLTDQTGGSALRMDTFGERGQLDVSFLRLESTDADISATGVWHHVARAIARAGFDAANKIYAVYYDGTHESVCGGASWPPLAPGRASIMYIGACPNAFTTSPDTMAYWEFAMLHDLMHTLGAVPTCAPNHVWVGSFGGHVDDPSDLMHSGDRPWRPATLDVGRDDYFGHGNPGCTDVANSSFLDPLPTNPEPPPGW